MDTKVLVLVEAIAKPECLDELVAMLKKGLPATRAAEGCREIRVHLEPETHTVVAVESWDSREHYEKYLAWREKSGAMAAMGQRLQEPLRIRFLQPLDA